MMLTKKKTKKSIFFSKMRENLTWLQDKGILCNSKIFFKGNYTRVKTQQKTVNLIIEERKKKTCKNFRIQCNCKDNTIEICKVKRISQQNQQKL